MHRLWLEATWFLKGLESSCLVRLAREMTTQTLAPGEVAPMHNLYVITRGLVLYGGRVLSRGMAWGDVRAATSNHLTHIANPVNDSVPPDVSPLSFLQLFKLCCR